MKNPDYFFLRHGETAFNRAGVLHGQLDSKLTDLGISQAQEQGKFLKNLNLPDITVIYSSPLGRAVETAEIITTFCSFEIRINPDLSEVMMGDWQGKTWDEITIDDPELFFDNKTKFEISMLAPEGERYLDLSRRARRFLSNACTPSIIVSHGVMLNILRGITCNLSFRQVSKLSQKQGEVFVVKSDGK
tara:strand:- start:144 stop:710 length:567 start_codon:yes stop_codon:yes gene_type:complete